MYAKLVLTGFLVSYICTKKQFELLNKTLPDYPKDIITYISFDTKEQLKEYNSKPIQLQTSVPGINKQHAYTEHNTSDSDRLPYIYRPVTPNPMEIMLSGNKQDYYDKITICYKCRKIYSERIGRRCNKEIYDVFTDTYDTCKEIFCPFCDIYKKHNFICHKKKKLY